MKKFEIFRELPKCDKETGREHAIGRMVPIVLLNAGFSQVFNFFKQNICKAHEVNHKKTRIKQGMSLIII
jgi:hypothetical protein